MKKFKYVTLLTGTFLIVIIATITLVHNTKKDGGSKTNELSADISLDEKVAENSTVVDESGIEALKEDDYTILLKGSARPQNGEIIAEDAAKIGIEEINKEYQIDAKDYLVEMTFLDGIVTDTGTWSGHINLRDNEKYEFIVDGKDGNIEFINKNDNGHSVNEKAEGF